jgi:hypothetical protein
MKILTINAKLDDPIGVRVARIRGSAIADLKRRLYGARRDVLAIYDSIPYEKYTQAEIINQLIANKTYYKYEQDPAYLTGIYDEIQATINGWMQTETPNKPARYFMDFYIDNSYSFGAQQSVNNIERITKAADLAQQNYEQILTSKPYFDRIANIRSRVFEEMVGFSGDTGKDLGRVLSNIVQNGTGITKARSIIADRFDVAISRAERIARTEINRAYTKSRTDTTKQTREEYGINIALMQISALSPTTRIWHAQRHGLVYTPEQQEEWWSSNGNRISCLCSVSEVLLDDDGKPLNKKLQDKRLKQKKEYLETKGK